MGKGQSAQRLEQVVIQTPHGPVKDYVAVPTAHSLSLKQKLLLAIAGVAGASYLLLNLAGYAPPYRNRTADEQPSNTGQVVFSTPTPQPTPTTIPTPTATPMPVLSESELVAKLNDLQANYERMPKEEVWSQVSLLNQSVYTDLTGKPFPHITKISSKEDYNAVVEEYIALFGPPAEFLKNSVGLTSRTQSGIEIWVKGEGINGLSANPLFVLSIAIGETGHAEWRTLNRQQELIQPQITAHRFQETLSLAYNAAAVRWLEEAGAINTDFPDSVGGRKAVTSTLDSLIRPLPEELIQARDEGWQILWRVILADPNLEGVKQQLLEKGRLTPQQNMQVRDYLLTIPPGQVPNYISSLPPITAVKPQMLQIAEQRYSARTTLAEWERIPTLYERFLP